MQAEYYNQRYYEAIHHDDYKIQDEMQYPLAYLSSSDPDTMYFDQAMNQTNRKEFLNEAVREVNSHCELNHWKLLPRKELPKGQPIL